MDQLESISQWIAQNQQTTLILGVAGIFGALIFLFWTARELMSWFLRTGQILDQVEILRNDVQKLTTQLAAQSERSNLEVAINAATAPQTAAILKAPTGAPLSSVVSSSGTAPGVAITSVPAAHLSRLMEQNSSVGQIPSNGPKFRMPGNDKPKSSFPIRHS